MPADSRWVQRNLGTPAAGKAAPAPVPVIPPQAARADHDPALVRIEFDSQGPEGSVVRSTWPTAPPTLDHLVAIPWPTGLAPKPGGEVLAGESLPRCDVLIVTWTAEEGHALSRVLTPGFDSLPPSSTHPAAPGVNYWKPYTKNYDQLVARMKPRAPARQYRRLGTYWTATIGGAEVTLFKSDSHFSQDAARDLDTTPNRDVWSQIIGDCRPRWVITTGTGGGIGPQMEVGDVVVSRFITFDPGGAAPALRAFSSPAAAPDARFAAAGDLLKANAQFLPNTNSRLPQIVAAPSAAQGILTTPGFQYDDTADTFHLKGKGDVCEMGDAVLGLACQSLGSNAPAYVAVRNVSDPEVDSSDPQASQLANFIYENFGRWSSVCSAIACWAIVAGL
jgi:nucleoside phosphorylase